MFQVAETAAKLVTTLRQAVLSPLAMYELTEGDTRDVTFAQTLPNEPHPALLQACPGCFGWVLHCRIEGRARQYKKPWPWENIHETDRVKRRFLEEFTTAYNALTFKPDVVPASVDAMAASVAGEEKPESEPQKVKRVTGKQGWQSSAPRPKLQ